MKTLYELIVVVHLLGMAAIVGAFFVVLRSPRFVPAFLWGAVTQLVSGVVLVGIRESGALPDEDKLNQAAVGVKLLIALAVAVLAWTQRTKRDAAPAGVIHSIGALAIVNVLIGALWIG